MKTLARALFACPRCAQPFTPEDGCERCGTSPAARDAVLDFFASADRPQAAREVTEFYERRPFPGYAPGDDAQTLLDRSRRSPFLVELDRALPPNATILDCGCGTAQVAAFLALAGPRRTVVGADACSASLAAAAWFRERARASNLRLVRTDLFALPLLADAFDVVICRGVVHHTPDPSRAIAEVARRVAPGGYLVLGIYENLARGLHCARRQLFRVLGRPIVALDPVLRRKDLHPEKKKAWIEDQYHHPLERLMSFTRTLEELEALGFEFVRSVPPAAVDGALFDALPRPSNAALLARRWGWFARGFNDEDAGLVAVVVRRTQGA